MTLPASLLTAMSTPVLSENFSWAEVTHSPTADRMKFDNSLPVELTVTVINTARNMERVRALLNSPVLVDSWYRSLALNRFLGSKDTSQHRLGEAVDFRSPEFGTPLDVCRKLIHFPELIRFDQLILEHTWVHISFCSDPNAIPRHQVLSLLTSGGYAAGLTNVDGTPL